MLYLPDEVIGDPRESAKDKDLVQRLESTVIHWTRQIKEVVSAQEASSHTADASGPLDEIEFWRRRTVDLSGTLALRPSPVLSMLSCCWRCCTCTFGVLASGISPVEAGALTACVYFSLVSHDVHLLLRDVRILLHITGISDQLAQDGVRNIVTLLSTAKSSYLGPFDRLAKLIQRGSEDANDNLKFLNTLTGVCTQLASSEPAEIPAQLPALLARIRVVGNLSAFYRNDEKLTSLLRKVC